MNPLHLLHAHRQSRTHQGQQQTHLEFIKLSKRHSESKTKENPQSKPKKKKLAQAQAQTPNVDLCLHNNLFFSHTLMAIQRHNLCHQTIHNLTYNIALILSHARICNYMHYHSRYQTINLKIHNHKVLSSLNMRKQSLSYLP